MAVVMRMSWPEVTPEQYEEARRLVHWEQEWRAALAGIGVEGEPAVEVLPATAVVNFGALASV